MPTNNVTHSHDQRQPSNHTINTEYISTDDYEQLQQHDNAKTEPTAPTYTEIAYASEPTSPDWQPMYKITDNPKQPQYHHHAKTEPTSPPSETPSI